MQDIQTLYRPRMGRMGCPLYQDHPPMTCMRLVHQCYLTAIIAAVVARVLLRSNNLSNIMARHHTFSTTRKVSGSQRTCRISLRNSLDISQDMRSDVQGRGASVVEAGVLNHDIATRSILSLILSRTDMCLSYSYLHTVLYHITMSMHLPQSSYQYLGVCVYYLPRIVGEELIHFIQLYGACNAKLDNALSSGPGPAP